MKRKILSFILSATMVLGAFSLSACANTELEAKLAELQTQITEQQTQIEELEQDNEGLQASVTRQRTQIATLEQENQELEEQIIMLNDMLYEARIEELVVDDMVDCSKFLYSEIKSSIGEPIYLNYKDDSAVFECSVEQGNFVILGDTTQYVKNTTVKAGGGFYWSPELPNTELQNVFIDIILKIDEHIVGYSVLQVNSTSSLNISYSATVLKSAIFPKVDGEYQNVSKEEVQLLIRSQKNIIMEL